MAVFDQRKIDDLEPYHTTNPRVETDDTWTGLWGSDHAFSKVLRDGDCDRKNRFLVHPDFQVMVSTHKSLADFHLDLRNSMPMGRLQPINAMPGVV